MSDGTGRRLDRIREVAETLRVDVQAPDMTEDILDRVALHRTFLDRRARRLVWATRLAIACCALLVAGVVVLVHERYPHVRGEEPRPTPLSTVVAVAQTEAARLDMLRGRLEIIAPAPAALNMPLTIDSAAPVRAVMLTTISPSGAAGATGERAVVFAAPAIASAPANAGAAELTPLLWPARLPSATEAVHRWAMTADAPSTPRLLRAAGLDEAPLLLQGPISGEIRLPR